MQAERILCPVTDKYCVRSKCLQNPDTPECRQEVHRLLKDMINTGIIALDHPDQYAQARTKFNQDVNDTARRLGIPFNDFNQEMHDLFVDAEDSGLNQEESPL